MMVVWMQMMVLNNLVVIRLGCIVLTNFCCQLQLLQVSQECAGLLRDSCPVLVLVLTTFFAVNKE